MVTERFPVEGVTYFDAIEFCINLSEREGLRPCYRLSDIKRVNESTIRGGWAKEGTIRGANVEIVADGPGYRLPTEAEWEYCARAGSVTEYFFGDNRRELGEYGWYWSNSGDRTHPVGEKKANPWGFYDMAGLVKEWCEDIWHDNYKGAPTDGSALRVGGDQGRRVVRGGSWTDIAGNQRSASRWGLPTSNGADSIVTLGVGFRVVLASP
jgi:formylglycine-generating enzyme required for sulfatase activity